MFHTSSSNKTMKNRMMKYMKLKNTRNWSKIMSPVLDAYNNSPHYYIIIVHIII